MSEDQTRISLTENHSVHLKDAMEADFGKQQQQQNTPKQTML